MKSTVGWIKEGILNLDVFAVEGLEGIAFGPYDLDYSLGIPGAGAEHPHVARALTEIEQRTARQERDYPRTTVWRQNYPV